MSAKAPMAAYSQYVESLRLASRSMLAGRLDPSDAAVTASLNGEAASELRRLVSTEERRRNGAFFTTSATRARLAEAVSTYGAAPYFDAACGAGDLLLAAADALPSGESPVSTLGMWSDQLFGRDISSSFVSAARLRLLMAALARHERGSVTLGRSFFGGISVGDGTRSTVLSRRPGTLLLNPPFGKQQAPPNCEWGSGGVSRAALYLEQAVRRLSSGSRVIAILPDVVRSGSNLKRFRTLIEELLEIDEIVGLGQFDTWTDIDVFLLVGTRRTASPAAPGSGAPSKTATWTAAPSLARRTLEDFFDIRVGPVVQTRDAMTGPWHPFLVAHELPRSGVVKEARNVRRFAGKTFQPPFVVVRRTDRPSKSGPRAVAVTIDGTNPVAVENHLLVLSPIDGKVETCEEIAAWLAEDEVQDFLDSRIRCRHLTTAALRGVPAPPDWVPLSSDVSKPSDVPSSVPELGGG